MRLLDLLHQPAQLWSLGVGFCERLLGYGPKSGRISKADKQIAQLTKELESTKAQLAIAEAKYDAIKAQLAEEQKAHMKQKNATSMMWKFIRTRHRISAPVEPVSILEALRRSGKR